MTWHRIWLCGSIWGLLLLHAGAQPGQLRFEHLTVEEGLPVNIVHHIGQDTTGFLWFGTKDGLSRFDGFSFRTFRHEPDDPYGLCNNNVQVVFPARDGRLWIGTYGGLNHFDPVQERFLAYRLFADDPGTSISSLASDVHDQLWVGTGKGLFVLLPGDTVAQPVQVQVPGRVAALDRLDVLVMESEPCGRYLWLGTNYGLLRAEVAPAGLVVTHHLLPGITITALLLGLDLRDPLWAGTKDGLYRVDSTATQGPIRPQAGGLLPGHADIHDLIRDGQGHLWLGTFAGLYQYDPVRDQFTHHTEDLYNPYSLSDDAIFDLFCDRKGDIWIGTYFGGVNVYHRDKNVFRHYFPTGRPGHMAGKAVSGIVETAEGGLWIGTEDAGLHRFDPDTDAFTVYGYGPGTDGPGSNNIQDVCLDAQGRLWVATYGGGLDVRDPGSGRFRHYVHQPGQPGSLPVNELLTLLPDGQGRLWIGTDKAGLCRLDPGTDTFRHYLPDPDRPGALASDVVMALYEDRQGTLWVGHFNGGLDRYDPDRDAFVHYDHEQPEGLSSDEVTCMYEDRQGRFWVGTRGGGLNLLDRRTGRATVYRRADGLPDNTIYGILEDSSGHLWLSTHQGLCRFSPESLTFRSFNRADGLQSNQFSPRAFLATQQGDFYFGGINGLNRFRPEEVGENDFVPPVVITGFRLFNQEVDFRQPDQPLAQAPYLTRRIVLDHRQVVFGFEFRVLDYTQPEGNRYAFIMEGFEEKWNEVGRQRTATFTNLDPGTYTFRVRGANNDGKWNLAGASIEVEVLPPPWRSGWAYFLYSALALGLLLLSRHYTLSRLRLQHDLKLERLRREKTEELEQAKQRFFTNISHELRTPLTLILGPLEQLMAQSAAPARETLGYMQRNTRRLLRLINQLMDFSKVESGNMQLELANGDLIEAVRQTAGAFTDLAHRGGIDFQQVYPAGSCQARFDLEKVDQILYNLLSNAFKYTGKGGGVVLRVDLPATLSAGAPLRISVRDTGPGIPLAEQARVFERYYQVPGEQHRHGTGIGLALSQELARLHGGQIELESQPGQGSQFTLVLPYETGTGPITLPAGEAMPAPEPRPAVVPVAVPAGAPLVLVVEDQDEVRDFLLSCLQASYRLLAASEGETALRLARTERPDLILSDVMMPGMDGLSLCRHLKTDLATSHIPVILLTARAAPAHQVEGWETGADGYLAKPFHPEVLQAHIANLIRSRQQLRSRFAGGDVEAGALAANATDERFLQDLVARVEAHLPEPEFRIQELAREMGMSHSGLYRKIKALTGQTAKEFLVNLRLRRAVGLLGEGQLNVSEVAFAVGFSDPKYFSTAFKKQYGCSPSAYPVKTT